LHALRGIFGLVFGCDELLGFYTVLRPGHERAPDVVLGVGCVARGKRASFPALAMAPSMPGMGVLAVRPLLTSMTVTAASALSPVAPIPSSVQGTTGAIATLVGTSGNKLPFCSFTASRSSLLQAMTAAHAASRTHRACWMVTCLAFMNTTSPVIEVAAGGFRAPCE
jgi:hypothetical protein